MQSLYLRFITQYRFPPRAGVVALLALVAGCDKVALLAPTGSTVTLSITSTVVGSGGSAEVVATVIEASGTPVHNGTEVRFQASVGTIEPDVARTESGIARATFRANGASGTASILAFSGGARSTAVEVRVGNAAAETVAVRTSPTTVPQNGGTVQVIATVRDASGNGLPGASVVFSTDNGTLSAGNAISDAQGVAQVSLTTNRASTVRASVAGKEGTASVTVTTSPSVGITINPTSPTAGQIVAVTVTPGASTTGNPIRDVTIDFGDRTQPRSLGPITSAQTVTHVYASPGSYTVGTTVTDVAGITVPTSTQVVVQPANVGVNLTVAPNPADAGSPVTVTVAPANPGSVPLTGIRVDFGDGSTPAQLGPGGGAVTKVYNTARTYTIRATATDQVGNNYTQNQDVVIRPRPALQVSLDAAVNQNQNEFTCTSTQPRACQTRLGAFVPPPGGQQGVRVNFTATASGTLAAPSSYMWDWGDGSPIETTSSSSNSHLFTAAGNYTIRVRVTTTDGNFGDQQLFLTISP